MVTVTGAKIVVDQVVGGDKMQNAAISAYAMSRPIAGATTLGVKFTKKSAKIAYDRRIKRKEP